MTVDPEINFPAPCDRCGHVAELFRNGLCDLCDLGLRRALREDRRHRQAQTAQRTPSARDTTGNEVA